MDSRAAGAGFAARFKKVVDEDRRTITAVARAIPRSEGAVRNWMTGRSQPVVSDVLRMCELTGTRVEWLMTGEGPQRETDPLAVADAQARYRATSVDEALLGAISLAVEKALRAHPGKLSP
jgi:hypothetical protein